MTTRTLQAPGRILLLGAGFSHNWGGWLAKDAFEYLIGRAIDRNTRELLWHYRNRGGFEAALELLQRRSDQQSIDSRETLLRAIREMFVDIEDVLERQNGFEFYSLRGGSVAGFLSQFDAIFTLNQDLLLEKRYFALIEHEDRERWSGPQLPGISVQGGSVLRAADLPCLPQSGSFIEEPGLQPIYKLHGSSNWTTSAGGSLLIVGGQKETSIKGQSLLSWYQKKFSEYLARANTRLVVIGYSFGDEHINAAIQLAAKGGKLRIFIVDPLGVDVFLPRTTDGPQIRYTSDLEMELREYTLGASRARLADIFGADASERQKLVRFLS